MTTQPMFDSYQYVRPGKLPAYRGARGISPASMRLEPGSDRFAVLEAYDLGGQSPLTDSEAADISGLSFRPGAEVWPRVNELLALGYLEMIGRRPNGYGKMVRECRITLEGAEAIDAAE